MQRDKVMPLCQDHGPDILRAQVPTNLPTQRRKTIPTRGRRKCHKKKLKRKKESSGNFLMLWGLSLRIISRVGMIAFKSI